MPSTPSGLSQASTGSRSLASMAKLRNGRWTNWAGNQSCLPSLIAHPATEGELSDVVKRASSAGQTVRVVGAGHSFTDCALSHDVFVVLDRYDQVIGLDQTHKRVTVQAGMNLGALNELLLGVGLALPNLGDISYQTVSGAVSTSTHGTGSKLGVIATAIHAMTLIVGDGSVVSCSADDADTTLFDCARVSLGALGIVSTLTFQCVEAFRLRAVEQAMRLDAVLESFDELMDTNDHMEFYWVPHTRWCLTKRNNRTNDPVDRTATKKLIEKTILENIAFGAVVKAGRLSPKLGSKVAKIVPSSGGPTTFVDDSFKVFTSPRFVKFVEMEYSIPREHLTHALKELVAWHEKSGLYVSFPVEVRTVARDDIALSTASGRDSAYIAVHMSKGTSYEQWFRVHESICKPLGGRPHWGKQHWQDAEDLAPRYAKWDDFQAQRKVLDPEGRFQNDYVKRVLGDITA